MESESKFNHNRLRELREQRGWSQRELARLCSFSTTLINRYENHEVEPSGTNIAILADIFNVSTDYLLNRIDIPANHIAEATMSDEEEKLITSFRREGWPGVLRLGADQIAK